MNKVLKVVLIFLAIDAVAVGLYFGIKALGGKSASPQDEYAWVTVDESYQPRNAVEEFIKADAAEKGLFPVYLKDYGRNAGVLKRFRGTNVAKANEAVLDMAFRGLQDWMLVDLKYKNEKERDVERTMLYIQVGGQWKVGDSGRLMK
ncbi:MAG TPA: hypothetical protein VEG35_04840 [Burkholderiales bacterium]|nr:hypothetical protein [Burkholderiales bacterium]